MLIALRAYSVKTDRGRPVIVHDNFQALQPPQELKQIGPAMVERHQFTGQRVSHFMQIRDCASHPLLRGWPLPLPELLKLLQDGLLRGAG